MDAQKEIKKECYIVKQYVLNKGMNIHDMIIALPRAMAIETNINYRKDILNAIELNLPWYAVNKHGAYRDLIAICVFDRIMDKKLVYENIDLFKNGICETIDKIESILLIKNIEYGNSVLEPIRIFSKANHVEQINVRLDDKLSRIMNDCKKTIKEDTVFDFIGYLILKIIAEKQK